MSNLIAISGKKGSGKDTAAKLLQYLIAGKRLKKYVPDFDFIKYHHFEDGYLTKESGYEIKRFAGIIKEITALLLSCKPKDLENRHFKYQKLDENWGQINTPRELMQLIGTEIGRNLIDKNFWVYHLFSKFDRYSKWIITDLRFKNEKKEVERLGGLTIRIERDSNNLVDTHSSETDLDHDIFDYVIRNNGTIAELQEELRKIVEKENL